MLPAARRRAAVAALHVHAHESQGPGDLPALPAISGKAFKPAGGRTDKAGMSKQHTTHKFATTTGTGRHVILDLDGSLANAYAVFSAPPELGRSFGYAKVVLPMHEVPQFGRDSKTGLVGLEALAYATSYDGKDSGRNPLELNTRSRSHDAHVQTWSGDRDCRVTMICSGVSRQTGSYLGMIIDLDGCSDADMQEINRLRWHGTAAEVQAKAYEVLAKLRAQA